MPHRSILASMLIKPAYEKSIDTVHDLLQTTADVMVAGNTSIATLINIDPRPSIQMLRKQTKQYVMPRGGKLPQFIREG